MQADAIPYWKFLIALHLSGSIGLIIVFFTAIFARGINRHPIWFSFILSWILWGLFWSLLVLTGQGGSGDSVPRGVCLFQASLLSAAPILTSGSTLSLVIHTWLVLQGVVLNAPVQLGRKSVILLVSLPYTLWLIYCVIVMAYGGSTSAIRLNEIQCIVQMPASMAQLPLGLSVVFSGLTWLLQVSIGTYLVVYRTKLGRSEQEYGPVFRVLLFAVLTTLSIAVEVTILCDVTALASSWTAFVVAIFTPCGLLIFGTQTDLVRAWMFWVPRRLDQATKV